MPDSRTQNINPSIRESSAKKYDPSRFPSISIDAFITVIFLFCRTSHRCVNVCSFLATTSKLALHCLLPAVRAAMPPLTLRHLRLIVTFVLFFVATSTLRCLLPAATMPPRHHSRCRTSGCLLPFFFFLLPTSTMRCLLPAAMISHRSCRHATTHAAAPPVDCYLFSFFAATFKLCTACCLQRRCHHDTTHAAAPVDCYIFSFLAATSTTTHCPLPAAMMSHGSCRHAITHDAAPPFDCFLFSAATSTLRCLLPAAKMLPCHNSRCHFSG